MVFHQQQASANYNIVGIKPFTYAGYIVSRHFLPALLFTALLPSAARGRNYSILAIWPRAFSCQHSALSFQI